MEANYCDKRLSLDEFVLLNKQPELNNEQWLEQFNQLSVEERSSINYSCQTIANKTFEKNEEIYSTIYNVALLSTLFSVGFSAGVTATIGSFAAMMFSGGKLEEILKQKAAMTQAAWKGAVSRHYETILSDFSKKFGLDSFIQSIQYFNPSDQKVALEDMFKKLIRANHPDKNENTPEVNEAFRLVNEAKTIWEKGFAFPVSVVFHQSEQSIPMLCEAPVSVEMPEPVEDVILENEVLEDEIEINDSSHDLLLDESTEDDEDLDDDLLDTVMFFPNKSENSITSNEDFQAALNASTLFESRLDFLD